MLQHSGPTITKDDIKAAATVLESGMIASGENVRRLEQRMTSFTGGQTGIATNSGRSALLLGLTALGANPEHEIIVPTYVCPSILEAIKQSGAIPVIADVDDNYCLSPNDVKKKITNKTTAIIAVHIFGISARIQEISRIAKENQIVLIEDCAQSIGGSVDGKKLGSFGHMAFFSFQATKVITSGEGGMLVIDNTGAFPDLNRAIKYKDFFVMSDIQAALVLSQLDKLDEFIHTRRTLARQYIKNLQDMPSITFPVTREKDSIFFRFPLRTPAAQDFSKLRQECAKRGAQVRKGVDRLLHHALPQWPCPNADKLFADTVSLPLYPTLPPQDVDYVSAVFREIAK